MIPTACVVVGIVAYFLSCVTRSIPRRLACWGVLAGSVVLFASGVG